MDRMIEEEIQARNRKKLVLYILTLTATVTLCLLLLRSYFSSSVNRSSITTAVVEKGAIENTITASGEVLPEFEETITSPINASIQNILLDAGSKIMPGQSALLLDKSASRAEYDKLKFLLETKQNEIQKLKLDLDKSFYDIQSSNNIKQISINSFEADVENAKRLYKAGGGTRADIDKAELNLHVAKLEKQQLENEIKNKQQTMQIEIKEARLAASIQERDLNELSRKLQLADIVARRGGVITWINKNIGASVKEGDALARIADLSSFKVQGSISDNYLDQLHTGMTAIIRVNDNSLRGKVINVQPSIQNNIVTFDIQLDERGSKELRPNMKVDVYLVTAAKSNVLRVANGPAFKGNAVQEVFVVRAGKATPRTVRVGMVNFDYIELADNVKPGDVIITSDMSAFKNAKEITIKN
jgi:HlyD family secretion protein